MNPELCKKALEKIGNPHILINLVSRRVRQLQAGVGASGRPLIENWQKMEPVDIALQEIIEEKITWEPIKDAPLRIGER